jgi:UDP-N-acetylglucosamine/UDP-N-acetyl-alpha-D-glucosaminouronate 4-epimerase
MLAGGVQCLVTGGAGFIGSHVAARLAALGYGVRIVDDLSTGDESNLAELPGTVEFVRGDLREPDVCRQAVEGVTVVFHLAAIPSVARSLEDPWSSHDANVNATLRLLEACKKAGVRRIVYSSSSSVYGDTAALPKVETAEPLPRSPYAASKLAGEQYVLAYARAGLVEGVALRYFNVFGPRQSPHSAYAAVIPAFMEAAVEGRRPVLFGDGTQTRDFTFVDNVVEANVLAATRPRDVANGQVMNVGAGVRTSLLALLDAIGHITGRRLQPEFRPSRPGDVHDSLASLDRAAQVLHYRPAVGLEDGLRRTWTWFLEGASELSVSRVRHRSRVAAGSAAGS